LSKKSFKDRILKLRPGIKRLSRGAPVSAIEDIEAPEPGAPQPEAPRPEASQPETPPSEAATADASPAIWENLITLNSDVEPNFELLGPAREHYAADSRKGEWANLDFQDAMERDNGPLPLTKDREGYYGSDHFSYWASGLRDARLLLDVASAHGVAVNHYLDFGCASGRVLRHMALQRPQSRAMGCDINRLHVEWCNAHLPSNCLAFQNHSVPSLPLPDASVDVVSAYSVFTHIEALETAWLMELRRILRPGGLAWITVHSELTLQEMNPNWPLWTPVMEHPLAAKVLDEKRNFHGDRLISRWLASQSYSSNVFYKLDYLKVRWSRFFEIAEVRRRCPTFQDVLILRKT
jgi:SAM-dependent methyltransferase